MADSDNDPVANAGKIVKEAQASLASDVKAAEGTVNKVLAEQSDLGVLDKLVGIISDISLIQIMLTLGALVLVVVLYRYLRGNSDNLFAGIIVRGKQWAMLGNKWLNGLAQFFQELFFSQDWKYKDSWFLLIGDHEVDTQFICQSLKSRMARDTTSQERSLKLASGAFHFLKKGALVCADDDKIEAAQSRTEFYRGLCRELVQLRSERPIDGIVLAIKAEKYGVNNSHELDRMCMDNAELLKNIQLAIEFSLPVYFLVVDCQHVIGFDDFWSVQSEALDKQQPFGWLSPYSSEIKYDTQYMEEALVSINDSLNTIQLHTDLNNTPEQSDGFLRFPGNLLNLRKGVIKLAEKVFLQSANPLLGFRGVFFCGLLESDKQKEAKRDHKALCFIDKFISDLVLSAPIQAEPTRKRLLSRNTYIRRFQISTAFLAIAAFILLFFNNHHLDEQINSVADIMRSLDRWQYSQLEHCENLNNVDEIYQLLSNMALVDANTKYPTIPLSWFDNVAGRVDKQMSARGMNNIVLPNLECQLTLEAKNLASLKLTESTDSAQSRLREYVQRVVQFEKNLENFKRITPKQNSNSGQDPIQILIGLMENIYGRPAPRVLSRDSGQHQNSLILHDYPLRWNASYRYALNQSPIEVCEGPNWEGVANHRPPVSPSLLSYNFCVLSAAYYRELLAQSRLAGTGDDKNSLLERIQVSPTNAYKDLKAWYNFRQASVHQVNSVGASPCEKARFELNEWVQELKDLINVKAGPLLEYSAALFEPNGECDRNLSLNLQTMAQALDSKEGDSHSDIGLFLDNAKGATYFAFSPTTDNDLMQCDKTAIAWNVTELATVASYLREYQQLIDESHLLDASVEANPLKKLAFYKLREAINGALNDAQIAAGQQTITGNRLVSINSEEAEIAKRATNFNRAANYLVPILQDMRQLQLVDSHSALTRCASDFALTSLDQIERFAAPLGFYTSLPNKASQLRLSDEFSYELSNKSELDDYLSAETNRLRILLSYMEPALTVLTEAQHAGGVDWSQQFSSVNYWRNTLEDFDAYQRELAQTELADLTDFYQSVQQSSDLCDSIQTSQTAGYGDSLFSKRRSRLEMALGEHCNFLLIDSVGSRYSYLVNEFNDRLANRYPFTLSPDNETEATVLDVRQFFIENNGVIKELVNTTKDLSQNDPSWREVFEFLSDLNTLNNTFANHLAHRPNQKPLFIQAEFNVLDDANRLNNQSAHWFLGNERFQLDNFSNSVSMEWQFGDPLTLAINWSEQSNYRIESTDTPLKYSKEFSGQWALFRMLDAWSVKQADQSLIVDENEQVLMVNLPLTVNEKAPANEQSQFLTQSPSTNLYFTVSLQTQGDGGNLQPLILPLEFPVKAPAVPSAQSQSEESYVYY